MKKKLLLMLIMAFVLGCFFAISAFAEVIISENNIDESGDIVADLICRVESSEEQHICSVDITYTTTQGDTKSSKIYYLIGLWKQQNKRQIETIYLPSDFDLSQIVYFFDKIDVDADGQYASNELIRGTRGGAFYIQTYTAFENGSFDGIADVKKTGVQAVSYSKYLTYFGGNTFSSCAALNSVTYNGRALEEFACIISPSVEVIMSGTFGGDGKSLEQNTVSANFARLVFEDRTGSLSFDQYCFTRNELIEIVFGSGRYALNSSDRIALLFKTENSKENCLERVILSKDTVLASGSISWYCGEYDVVVLGTESECASIYEANCKKALPNAKSVTYNPCYFGHTEAEDDGDCTTAVLCVACGVFEYKAPMTHTEGESVEYASYFENGYYYFGCQNEGCNVKEATVLAPLFESLGYSYTTFGTKLSVVQGFKINKEAVEYYISYNPDFEMGFVAAVNLTNEEIAVDLNGEKVVSGNISLVNNCANIKISGITEANFDLKVICCLYIIDKEEIRFLDGGFTKESLSGISYNDIVK